MLRHSWGHALILLGGCLVLSGCDRARTNPTAKLGPDAPSVLLITLDTTRADRLGCYGYPQAQTPALDALAGAGVRFERAFCQVPLTLPSHASLMTGMYPPTTGVRLNSNATLSAGLPTLAGAFQTRGYRTGAFIGAWVLNSAFGLNRGFDRYDDQIGETTGELTVAERPADKVCDAALAWLDEAPDRPFFAWVHFYDVHSPYQPPAPFREKLADPYDGEIAFVDSQVARLLGWLDAHRCRSRTLVIAVGDHGEAFGEHGEIQHGFFIYDPTVHVPLIFSWPDRLPRDKVVRAGVPLVDVMPTVLELLGWAPAAELEGESVRAAFEAENVAFRAIYSECESPHTSFGWASLHSFTTGQWRYIEAPRPELYDRSADPSETNNVIELHRDVAARLKGALEEAEAAMPERGPGTPVLDPRAVQALQTLGYLGTTATPNESDTEGRDPKDMVAVYRGTLAAHQAAMAKQYAEVIKLAEPLVRQSPESNELYTLLGKAYLSLGRFDAAAAAYLAGLRSTPDDPSKLCLLGDALVGQGKINEAINSYERALAVSANSSQAHNRLGTLYFRRKELVKAEEHFRRCVELGPPSADAFQNLASVLVEMNRPDEAVKLLRCALKRNPAHALSHRLLWQVLMSQQRPDEAISALRAACQALPKDLGFRRTLATLLAGRAQLTPGADREAVEIARTCCSQEPANPENHDVLGMACAAVGDFAGAVQAARQALQLAQSQNRADLAAQIAQRLQVYESRLR